jgi:hypothetical protein
MEQGALMPESLSEALVQFVLAALSLATLAVTAVVIPYVRAKVGAERWETAQRAADIAVRAVEQTSVGDDPWRFAKADEMLQELEGYGLKLTPEQRRALIEASVLALKDLGIATLPPGSVTTGQGHQSQQEQQTTPYTGAHTETRPLARMQEERDWMNV